MKNLFTFLLIGFLTLTFGTSCSSDDDIMTTEIITQSKVQGLWTITNQYETATGEDIVEFVGGGDFYMNFYSGGKCLVMDTSGSVTGPSDTDRYATYEVKDNKLIVRGYYNNNRNPSQQTYTIRELTNTYMEIDNVQFIYKLTKRKEAP